MYFSLIQTGIMQVVFFSVFAAYGKLLVYITYLKYCCIFEYEIIAMG